MQSKADSHDAKCFKPQYSFRFTKFSTKKQIQVIHTLALCPLCLQKLIKRNTKNMWSIPPESFSSQVNCRSVLSIRNEFEKISAALCFISFVNHCPNSVYTSQILELLSPTFTLNIEQLIMSPQCKQHPF